MKLLLDENLPHKLRQCLPGHEVFTSAYMGWTGKRNGDLLRLAADAKFDALIAVDAGLEYQQNLRRLPCSVIVIRCESNAFEHIEPLIPALISALEKLSPNTLIRVG